MIADFDELVLRCRDDSSRSHIREAVLCYQSGAYRAAIVAAYVALCLDLIEKLRALASQGDGSATLHLQKLQGFQDQLDAGNLQAVSGLLDFERTLLELFRDEFEFFGANEYEELVRLRSDRNRCAHPTFFKSSLPYNPPAELARLHIRNVLVLVLMQEPRQGKAALANLQAAILSKYFPTEVLDAVERLRSAGLSNARDVLIRGFVDGIVFGVPDEGSLYFRKFGPARVALHAAIEISRQIALPRAVMDTNKLLHRPEDESVQFGALLALQIPEIGAGLDAVARQAVRHWVRMFNSKSLVNVLRFALNVEWLRDEALERLASLDSDSFHSVVVAVPAEIVSRAAELYAGVSSWDEASSVGDRCAMPLVTRFSEADLEIIFRATSEGRNDLKSSGHFKRFVNLLRDVSPLGKLKIDSMLEEFRLEVPESGAFDLA